ncbi:D-glycero-D-manno-heptose 7-phosphate kinase [Nitrosopumilus piranensis]|uniref:GHMP family kinase ATP-binding protein n=1 Tax=Nitrosopumilus piranensis TaxID=1582439 RepID=UPI0011E5D02D|nr:D-glycero-D-manno-heptose 7-phosphate kinase [Nitrosopumilus piranensis]
MIIGSTPVRISFSGGGTDMPEYFNEFGGNVLTSTISKFTYAIFHPRYDDSFQAFSPDFEAHYKPTKYSKIKIETGSELAVAVIKYLKFKQGVNVIVASDVPGGSGLGGSGSLTVNLVYTIHKIKQKKISKSQIAEDSFHIGRKLLKMPIGKQDEYIASYGGLKYITFNKEKIKVEKIKINKPTLKKLDQNLILFFVGDTRNSTSILSQQLSRIKNKDKVIINSLNQVKLLCQEMHDSLRNNDITKFGEILNKSWLKKREFVKGVSNSKIDKIYQIAIKNGATGGKLTGAGGGGHMLFYCEKKNQQKLIHKLESMKLKHIDFNLYDKGPEIAYMSNKTQNQN